MIRLYIFNITDFSIDFHSTSITWPEILVMGSWTISSDPPCHFINTQPLQTSALDLQLLLAPSSKLRALLSFQLSAFSLYILHSSSSSHWQWHCGSSVPVSASVSQLPIPNTNPVLSPVLLKFCYIVKCNDIWDSRLGKLKNRFLHLITDYICTNTCK